MRKTHIPGDGNLTFCGRNVRTVDCIDLQTVCIEDATCLVCLLSDERRQREAHPPEVLT